MKIGLVLHAPIAYSEIFFLNQIIALQELGFTVTVFTKFSDVKNLEYDHRRALPIRPRKLGDIFFVAKGLLQLLQSGIKPAFRLYSLEREYGSTVLAALKRVYFNTHILTSDLDHLHFGFATVAIERELVAKSLNIKFSVSLRGSDISVYPLFHQGCYDKLWDVVDKVHIVSEDLYQKALKVGLSRKKPVTLIQEGLHLDDFPDRTDYGEIGNPMKIISVGRLHWIKGYSYALQAIKMLVNRGYNIQYSIIGSGEQEEEIRFALNQMKLTKYVELRGQLSHKMVIEALYDSHVFLQTSLYEGFSQAVLEAQAVGLLLIVSEAGSMEHNVVQSKSGWIVEGRNSLALADTIEEVINLPNSKRNAVASFARERVKQNFNFNKFVKSWKEFLSDFN